MNTTKREWISAREAAERLGLSVVTLRWAAADGHLPHERGPLRGNRRPILFDPEIVEKVRAFGATPFGQHVPFTRRWGMVQGFEAEVAAEVERRMAS